MISWMKRMMVLGSIIMIIGPAILQSALFFASGFVLWATGVVMLFTLFNKITKLLIWILIGGILFVFTIIALLAASLSLYASTDSAYGGLVWAAFPVSLVITINLLLWKKLPDDLRRYLIGICVLGYPAFYLLFTDNRGKDIFHYLWGEWYDPNAALLASIGIYITLALMLVFQAPQSLRSNKKYPF